MSDRDSRLLESIRMFLLGLVIVALMMFCSPGWTDPHPHGGDDADGDVVTTLSGGDVGVDVVGGSFSTSNRAFGLSGGDMDIDDCLSTWSILWGLGQDVKTNPYCFAMQLDRIGKHKEAAEMRCSVRRIKKVYGDNCIAAMTAAQPPSPAPVEVIDSGDDEGDDARDEQIEMLQIQVADQQMQFDELEARRTKAASRPPRLKQKPAPRYTDEDQAYILDLYADKESDNE